MYTDWPSEWLLIYLTINTSNKTLEMCKHEYTQFVVIWILKYTHYVPLSAQLLECAITLQLHHEGPAKVYHLLNAVCLERIKKKITNDEIIKHYFDSRCRSPLNTRVKQIVHSCCSDHICLARRNNFLNHVLVMNK